jgi:hypothetical protein
MIDVVKHPNLLQYGIHYGRRNFFTVEVKNAEASNVNITLDGCTYPG